MNINSLAYIRATYGVPAFKGGRIRFNGQLGTIVCGMGARLGIRLDGEGKDAVRPYHPKYNIEYLSKTPKATA